MLKELRRVRIPEEAAPGTEFVVFRAKQVVENGITRITVARSGAFNRDFTPAGQEVKWFEDELGQLWVKFDLAPESHQQNVVTLVIPASRVVEVQFRKREKPC
jgi:hypothetical protein